MSDLPNQEQQQAQAPELPDTGQPVPAERLMGGRASIQILHRGQVYQLSLTRNGKLILTK